MFPTYAPAIDFDGGKYGVGMLSKEKPVSYRYIALPGREEERVLLWVEFERYIFCCTHLSLTPEDRMLSLPILRREAASAHKPLIYRRGLERYGAFPLYHGNQQGFPVVEQS